MAVARLNTPLCDFFRLLNVHLVLLQSRCTWLLGTVHYAVFAQCHIASLRTTI